MKKRERILFFSELRSVIQTGNKHKKTSLIAVVRETDL